MVGFTSELAGLRNPPVCLGHRLSVPVKHTQTAPHTSRRVYTGRAIKGQRQGEPSNFGSLRVSLIHLLPLQPR